MTEQDLEHQIIEASDYLLKGGDIEKWFKSKDFEPTDEETIREGIGYQQ